MTHASKYVIGAASFEAGMLVPGLYIVATPIGNLGDMTIRGLETLAAADAILCEDTRTTAKLLERYAIRNRLEPYHEHNAAKVRPRIIARLKEGAAMALVSDAGMPLISDPGYRLAAEARKQRISVTCCPGPSAVLAALALSGLPSDRFAFFGFMPQKKGERSRLLAEIAQLKSTAIFFESPQRIVSTLEQFASELPGRTVAVARELTKLHEEVLRGDPKELAVQLSNRPSIKGEITLLIDPPTEKAAAVSETELDAAIAAAMDSASASQAASEVAKKFGLARRAVYARILALQEKARD